MCAKGQTTRLHGEHRVNPSTVRCDVTTATMFRPWDIVFRFPSTRTNTIKPFLLQACPSHGDTPVASGVPGIVRLPRRQRAMINQVDGLTVGEIQRVVESQRLVSMAAEHQARCCCFSPTNRKMTSPCAPSTARTALNAVFRFKTRKKRSSTQIRGGCEVEEQLSKTGDCSRST